jgi:hypothetical protein
MAMHTEHGTGWGTLKATENRSEIWIADSPFWRADKGHRKLREKPRAQRKAQSSEKSTKQRRAQSSEKSTE